MRAVPMSAPQFLYVPDDEGSRENSPSISFSRMPRSPRRLAPARKAATTKEEYHLISGPQTM